MKNVLATFVLTMVIIISHAQVPQGFNYQALASDVSGNPLKNTPIQVKVSILSDTITPVIVWEELHPSVTTSDRGVFSIIIGTGTRQSTSTEAAFNNINWSAITAYLKTQIFYQNSWKSTGSAKIWSVPYAMVAGDLGGNLKKLSVTGETSNMEEALFEVKNKDGQTVFAVYNDGVRIYIDDAGSKGKKGGFAIGGFGTAKSPSQDYFVVKPDTIRMYIDDSSGKGTKGGFAIGGFGTAKGTPPQPYFIVNPDSIRGYIGTEDGKGTKGGFAIGGFSTAKSPLEEYFRVTRDSTRVYLNDTGSKGRKGGFAIGSFGTAKGSGSDYFLVNPDSTRFYVRSQSDQESSTFSIIGIDQNFAQKSLMKANPDTMFVAGVLDIQNNLIVSGNIDMSGTINLISDIDGNSYKTVQLGTQVWMAENLKTTKYNDGTTIQLVADNSWSGLSTPAYCWYNNDLANKSVYGALYNWFAVNTGKLCPVGWHVSTDDEWHTLLLNIDPNLQFSEYISTIAGAELKEAGTGHWEIPNSGATNKTGFTALPGGGIYNVSTFYDIGFNSYWWTATEMVANSSWIYGLFYNATNNERTFRSKQDGYSVRCLKDI